MSITRGTFFRFHTTTHTYMITNFQSFKIKLYLRLTYIFNHLHNFPWFPFCLQYIFSLHHNNWIVLFSMVYLYESAKYLILNKNCTSFREKLWTFSDKQTICIQVMSMHCICYIAKFSANNNFHIQKTILTFENELKNLFIHRWLEINRDLFIQILGIEKFRIFLRISQKV